MDCILGSQEIKPNKTSRKNPVIWKLNGLSLNNYGSNRKARKKLKNILNWMMKKIQYENLYDVVKVVPKGNRFKCKRIQPNLPQQELTRRAK